MHLRLPRTAFAVGLAIAAACASMSARAALQPGASPDAANVLAPFGEPGKPVQSPWHVDGLPDQTKPFTLFSVVDIDGRRSLRMDADKSYGDLVQRLPASVNAGQLHWAWRLEQPLAHSDLRNRSGDDSAAKVCAFFDEPMARLSFGERQLLRLFRARSGEPVPTATICYVWDTTLPVGTALDNAFTRRIRYIVLESGAAKKGAWISEQRDLAADFSRLFGAESPEVPKVTGVALGADADNTQGHSIADVADVVLRP